jgi:hypothetical protein
MRKKIVIATLMTGIFAAAALATPSLAHPGGGGGGGHGGGAGRGGAAHGGSIHAGSMRMYSAGRMHAYNSGRTHSYRMSRANGWQGRSAWNHHRNHHGQRFFVAGGFPYWYDTGYYDYDYGYGSGGCGWVYQRALATGSSYWWHRYQACLY